MLRKTYRPQPDSKSHLAKVQQAIERGHHAVKCRKCGATHKTLRKLPLRGETVYYCEDCIKKAMKENKDVRED
jgi:late competence protein required for DNA uptake (superfamily II DNA/RNA helicase)